MTVAAINPVVATVMLMAELNGLLALCPLSGVPGRAVDLGQHPDSRDENEDSAEDTQPSKKVGAMVKNLWHRRKPFLLTV
jgi:hypothetical protein